MDIKLVDNLKRDLFLGEKAHLVGGMKTFIELSNARIPPKFQLTFCKVKQYDR